MMEADEKSQVYSHFGNREKEVTRSSLSELRARRERGERLTRRESFRLLASDAARNYYNKDGWSSTEKKFAKLIEEETWLKLNEDFYHNFPVWCPHTKKFCFIDFLFPAREEPFDFGYWPEIPEALFEIVLEKLYPCEDGKAVAVELNPDVWHLNLGKTEEMNERKYEWLKKLGFEVVIFISKDLKNMGLE